MGTVQVNALYGSARLICSAEYGSGFRDKTSFLLKTQNMFVITDKIHSDSTDNMTYQVNINREVNNYHL